MLHSSSDEIIVKKIEIISRFLSRKVTIDLFLPAGDLPVFSVLLLNDGQDLDKMPFADIFGGLLKEKLIHRIACVGIHAGPDRRREYGTAASPDYLGRGNKAAAYSDFVTRELIPFLETRITISGDTQWAFAGFSLGGLSALDIGWHFPECFRTLGIFSGSLWWRSLDTADPGYQDEQHRLMHNAIRNGRFVPGRRFFFECGTEDEREDRNHNGIIDSIDDTLDLIGELKRLGHEDIFYLEIAGGRHDVATWALAMKPFLTWAWGLENEAAPLAQNKNAAYGK